ncbi:MAG: PAS domain S-box protein [Anaerolineales bacterium]
MNQEQKGTVLVVDDEAANLGVLFEFLRQADYKVLVAEDGADALEVVNRSQPDIILLDVKMPDMDGFELYRRMKEIGLTADTPVIFLSVLTETMDKVRALDMNAVDYITKPFEPLEVVARVEKHLTLHNLRQRLQEQNAQLQQEIAERGRAEAALRQRNEEQATINAIAAAVNQSPELYHVLRTALAEAERALGLQYSEIWLLDESTSQLRPSTHNGLPDDFALEIPFRELGAGLPGIVAQTGRPLLIEDLAADPRFQRERGRQYDLHSALGIPLMVQERTVGVMNFFAPHSERFTPELKARLVTIGHLVGVAIDNSRLYAALAEKTIYLDNILRSASEYAIVTTDLDLRITYFNPLAEQFYGCPEAQAIGKTVEEICPWERPAERFEQGLANIRAHGEHRYVMAQEINGEMRHFASRVSGITDQEGELVGYARFSRDITARVLADEQLRQLSQAVERSANCVIITDVNGDIEYVNPRFTQVSGYTSEEVLGENARILKSASDPLPPEEYKHLWETITAGDEWRGEIHNQTKDGQPYWQFATITPIKNAQGVITHFLSIQEDITARRQAEAALREGERAIQAANRARSDFLANVSGELRTPVDAILSFAQVLERDPDATSAQRESLDVIRSSGEYLLGLIDKMLEMAEGEAEQ